MKTGDITDFTVCQAVHAAWLEWCEDRHPPDQKPRNAVEMLVSITGAPEKVAYSALHRADSRDLIGYGTSIRCSWVEPPGFLLLQKGQQ